MGVPKGGGYQKLATQNKQQKSLLNQILGLGGSQLSSAGDIAQNPLYQQAVGGVQSFLPGGEGFAPIQQEAMQNFEQSTIPSILNKFGSGAKTSSALNQALGAAGKDLNTNLASLLSQYRLGASNQAANLAQIPHQQGLQSATLGLGTQPFAFAQRAAPFWQDLLLAGISGGSKVASSFVGRS